MSAKTTIDNINQAVRVLYSLGSDHWMLAQDLEKYVAALTSKREPPKVSCGYPSEPNPPTNTDLVHAHQKLTCDAIIALQFSDKNREGRMTIDCEDFLHYYNQRKGVLQSLTPEREQPKGDAVENITDNPKSWIAWKLEAERLADKLEALAGDSWRPIDSAPKDGTPMLVYSTGKHIGRATWNADESMFEDEHHEFIDPRWLTYWHPLPPPPEPKS